MSTPLLSVVTGTYNRLPYLKAFMESCEQSIIPEIDFEFCICDGGSTDGTLEWLKGEASEKYNITLIEHGELKGAIKAFNDAAAAAKGDYLLIGNDDIIVQEDSITRALGELLSDPTLGAACFYQDRAGRDWHVETMEITLPSGVAGPAPYLQVGIIPKFLWDYAGGWGDFGSNTYGGDNWVSAKVYEAGYSIKAIEGAKIHDRTPIDELRKINNEMNRGGADGKKFYAAFPDGITYNDEPQFPNPIHGKYKKILYAPIYEPGNEVQKQQKRGLRDALAKHGIVYEVDYLACKSIALAARAWLPDMTVTQLHSADKGMVEQIKEVRKHTRESMINWCGDTYTDQNSTPEFLECMRYFDLHTSVNNTLKDFFKKNGVNYNYWQIGYEPLVLPQEEGDNSNPVDILFCANIYSEKRKELILKLNSLPYSVKFLGSGYPSEWETRSTLYDFEASGKHIRSAKIVLGDNQFGDEGFVSNRLFESLAAGGALMLHQEVPGMEELIGFKDGEHYVKWTDFDDLKEKIAYYLNHEDERQKIADAGTRECRENHSFDKRVEELFEILKTKPLKSYEISVHMICKDEMQYVERVLKTCERFAAEIVIVDTGSTDGTLELLREREGGKLKVYEFEWCDDFAKARNFALSKCTKNWAMWLDFDDELPERTIQSLQNFHKWDKTLEKRGVYNPLAYKLLCVDALNGQAASQTRVVRRLEGIEYRSPIHETLDDSLGELGIDTDMLSATRIIHQGNLDPEIVEKKQQRNLRIINKLPDSPWKFLTMAWTNMSAANWADAIVCTSVIMNRYKGVQDKETTDYCNFIAGFCFERLGLGEEAVKLLKSSDFKDSYFILSNLEPQNRVEWLLKFMSVPHSEAHPSFSFAWEREAKEHLAAWHRQKLEEFAT